MAEYLAPGVYVEETSFRSRSIEGVSTSTAAFVGPTRYGPIRGEPEIVTSLPAFERVYGGLDRLNFGGRRHHNYVAQAVRAFFNNRGRRMYVVRTYAAPSGGDGEGPAEFSGHGRTDSDGSFVGEGISDKVVDAGSQVTIDFENAFAPDADKLTFSQSGKPGWLDFLPEERKFEGTPTDAGTKTVKLTATDSDGRTSSIEFFLTVRGSDGSAPLFVKKGMRDQTVPLDEATEIEIPEDAFGNVTESDSGLTYSVTKADEEDGDIDWVSVEDGKLKVDARDSQEAIELKLTASRDGDESESTTFRLVVGKPQGAPDYGDGKVELIARFPGEHGNVEATFAAKIGPNVLPDNASRLAQLVPYDTVYVRAANASDTGFYDVERAPAGGLILVRPGVSSPFPLAQAKSVHVVTLNVSLRPPVDRPLRPRQEYAAAESFEGLAPSPRHATSMMAFFAEHPSKRSNALTVPIFLRFQGLSGANADEPSGAVVAHHLLGEEVRKAILEKVKPDATIEGAEALARVYRLVGGSDGKLPSAKTYEGDEQGGEKSGLRAIEDLENVSIVAAPGYSASAQDEYETIQGHLISHCERMRYRVAVLDSRDGLTVGGVRDQRGKIDSEYAALYYPWVRVLDPITGREIVLPSSGFVAGIYARNDVERGVHKAPANEVVRLAIGFETLLDQRQQEVLNPEGINCFRFFEGRGLRLWGARTISSDPLWKYVSTRRYFAYLEQSIDEGTQWVVFEPNTHVLWGKVRRTIEDFLYNEWANHRLMGTKPDQAFFVRCDRSTMTQNDIDGGRLVCLVGVAVVKPAEFVVFRIGQWTGEAG